MQGTVFITGSTGLIGGHLINRLFRSGAKIKALIRPTSSLSQLRLICEFYSVSFDELYNSVEWVYGDTLDFVGLMDYMEGVEEVFHCAAVVSFNNKNRSELLTTNVKGTSNMVDAALRAGVKKFCFISSIGSLGNADKGSFIDEDSYRDPNKKNSPYSESKYLSELEVWRGSVEGLNVIILNPGVVLGPGKVDKGSLLLFNVGRKGIPFYTDAATGYVDVRDICTVALQLMEKEIFGKRFVLVSGNYSNKEIFSMIANEFGKKGPSIKAGKCLLKIAAFFSTVYGLFSSKTPQLTKDSLKSAVNSQYYSSDKIIRELNFNFIPIRQTIKETALFIKENKL
jgi:nucleoside-diphosphate-sugar epimerase